MDKELDIIIKTLNSTIENCQKIQPKFLKGTSQYTLLENRINALNISINLLTENKGSIKYKKEELLNAKDSITSIINKCEKAQKKFLEGTAHYTRIKNMIRAMEISKEYITKEINDLEV
jgi:hypothetical protein